MPAEWIVPEGLPPGIGAVVTTRAGGVSGPPRDSMNVGTAVGDDPQSVAENRRRLAIAMGAAPVFMRQVHGVDVADLDAAGTDAEPRADASVCSMVGIACTVQIADCLPVLLAAPAARAVAAAHAGWRGMAAGVVEAAVHALCERAHCAPRELWAWLGPSIGPTRFEVGRDVLEAFRADPQRPDAARFRASGHGGDGPKWLANLPQLACDRLRALGVVQIGGGRWCTVLDRSRFFSFRRDRVTGRMAAAIWLLG
jgi:YfiH family protein